MTEKLQSEGCRMTQDKRGRQMLGCRVNEIEYSFVHHAGRLYMDRGDCCDMADCHQLRVGKTQKCVGKTHLKVASLREGGGKAKAGSNERRR
jgi:hypothetical protein